jgi:hypothetical protein
MGLKKEKGGEQGFSSTLQTALVVTICSFVGASLTNTLNLWHVVM